MSEAVSSVNKAKIVLPAIVVGAVLTFLITSNASDDDQVVSEVLGTTEIAEDEVAGEPGAPVRIEITRCDVDEEELEIVNRGGSTVNLAGWILHDDGRVWEGDLSEVTLGAGESIVLLSGDQGFALPGMYRWTFGNVWNNRGGDIATILRPDGLVAATFDCI